MSATDALHPEQFKYAQKPPARSTGSEPGSYRRYSPDWTHPKKARAQIVREATSGPEWEKI